MRMLSPKGKDFTETSLDDESPYCNVLVGLTLCLLGAFCQAKQSPSSADNEATPPSLVWTNADRQSSAPPPPLKLDPVLRRALLRALTQLELEAQRKTGVSSTEHAQPTPTDQEINIKRDLEELLGNYENAYNQQKQANKSGVDGQADVSVFDYDSPSERPALFFRSDEGDSAPVPNADIQSNIIPLSSPSAKRVNEADSSALETAEDKKSLDKSISSAVGGAVKLDLDDQEVSIFQAPLVAAFTLQQDERGNPRSVVPLLRRQQPVGNQQQQQRFQFGTVDQPPPTPDHQRAQRQETGTAIVDFQQSQEFQLQPNFRLQQPAPLFRAAPPPSNFFFQGGANPSSVNSQLQNLLYQSGVAPQEDLNIVSKVLSLNHEGRGTRPGRETLELTAGGVDPPSRVIEPPFP
ncbi:hypothetical protein C0J52_00641 [Blattella germanica]|nr:hypothetical protein C0J52_00641 [Blattella germanica]